MKILLLALACAILSLQAYSQPSKRIWDTKIRKTCFYGIAATPVPIYEMAAADAKKIGMVSMYDSINFVHQMNGYWYVLTDKGGNGYVKNLRYRPIDLDSLKNLEKYRLLALQAAKEKAAKDSAMAAEHQLLVYSCYDSATAQQVLQKQLWYGMSPEMAQLSIGEPNHSLSPLANGSSYETWEYNDKCLYFKDGYLADHEAIEKIEAREEDFSGDGSEAPPITPPSQENIVSVTEPIENQAAPISNP